MKQSDIWMKPFVKACGLECGKMKMFVFSAENVGAFGGCFGVTAGLFDEFGDKRVRDTPISEGVIIGCAVGSAAAKLRPIAELMFIDFLTVGMDQLVNQAAKMRYMFGGNISVPMVVRLPGGGGVSAAAQHSQSLRSLVNSCSRIKVVYPSTPQDALGLMLSAIDDEDPVMFVEHKAMYGMKGDVDDVIVPIKLGVGDIKRAGTDITVVATGKMVHEALKAAANWSRKGISVEVIDPRTLYPLDKQMIFNSIEKTTRVVLLLKKSNAAALPGIGRDDFGILLL